MPCPSCSGTGPPAGCVSPTWIRQHHLTASVRNKRHSFNAKGNVGAGDASITVVSITVASITVVRGRS